MKLTTQKYGQMNDSDRLELARLLLKMGYQVRIGKDKGKDGKGNIIFVEYRLPDQSTVTMQEVTK